MITAFDVVTLTLNPALDVSTAVERMEPGAKLRCEAPRYDPGGGGVNVARAVRRMGGSSHAVFPAGGPTGQRLCGLLRSEGVDFRALPIAGETRECFTVEDRGAGAEYRFVLPGPTLSRDEQRHCLDAALAATEPGAVIVVSGSLTPGAAPALMGEIARRAAAKGARLVVDSSGPALRSALDAGVELIKPNLKELAELHGAPLPDLAARLAACRQIIARGAARMVAVSLGAEGALLVTEDEAWSAPALAINPVSTVGAGDSFLGALLYALRQDAGLAEALGTAIAAGAAALLVPGTGLCRREDVDALRQRVQVSPVT